jgi:hypothetical protein
VSKRKQPRNGPPKLDLENYPHLPLAEVALTPLSLSVPVNGSVDVSFTSFDRTNSIRLYVCKETSPRDVRGRDC